jgi:gamma-glutamyltranspeptidase/glutathione hydrolase
VPEAIRQWLISKGDKLEVRGAFATPMGGGQAVIHDSATGVNFSASSPRKDGAAVPEPDPYFSSDPPGKSK